jgi:predicted deacylase
MIVRALAIVLLAAAPGFAQSTDGFTVGTATAQRGAVANGYLQVASGLDAGTNIPVTVVNGAKSGPVVAFVAGSHGTEYSSIVALTQLASRIDPKALTGAAIILPLVNVASFEQMTVHTNPIDRLGMNAQYPGDAKGTQTQRALAMIAEEVVKRAGTIVDLHGGDLDEDLVPYSYWIRGGNETADAASKALVLAFGLDRIIINDVDTSNPASARTLSSYSISAGKTVVVAEAGASGVVNKEDVNALVDGCLNVLGELKMISRDVRPVAQPVWLGSGARVRAETPGIFTAAVRGGTYVSNGMRVGTMTDYHGRPLNDVRAPMAGLVTFIRGVPSAWKDATLVNVAPVYVEPPAYVKPAK